MPTETHQIFRCEIRLRCRAPVHAAATQALTASVGAGFQRELAILLEELAAEHSIPLQSSRLELDLGTLRPDSDPAEFYRRLRTALADELASLVTAPAAPENAATLRWSPAPVLARFLETAALEWPHDHWDNTRLEQSFRAWIADGTVDSATVREQLKANPRALARLVFQFTDHMLGECLRELAGRPAFETATAESWLGRLRRTAAAGAHSEQVRVWFWAAVADRLFQPASNRVTGGFWAAVLQGFARHSSIPLTDWGHALRTHPQAIPLTGTQRRELIEALAHNGQAQSSGPLPPGDSPPTGTSVPPLAETDAEPTASELIAQLQGHAAYEADAPAANGGLAAEPGLPSLGTHLEIDKASVPPDGQTQPSKPSSPDHQPQQADQPPPARPRKANAPPPADEAEAEPLTRDHPRPASPDAGIPSPRRPASELVNQLPGDATCEPNPPDADGGLALEAGLPSSEAYPERQDTTAARDERDREPKLPPRSGRTTASSPAAAAPSAAPASRQPFQPATEPPAAAGTPGLPSAANTAREPAFEASPTDPRDLAREGDGVTETARTVSLSPTAAALGNSPAGASSLRRPEAGAEQWPQVDSQHPEIMPASPADEAGTRLQDRTVPNSMSVEASKSDAPRPIASEVADSESHLASAASGRIGATDPKPAPASEPAPPTAFKAGLPRTDSEKPPLSTSARNEPDASTSYPHPAAEPGDATRAKPPAVSQQPGDWPDETSVPATHPVTLESPQPEDASVPAPAAPAEPPDAWLPSAAGSKTPAPIEAAPRRPTIPQDHGNSPPGPRPSPGNLDGLPVGPSPDLGEQAEAAYASKPAAGSNATDPLGYSAPAKIQGRNQSPGETRTHADASLAATQAPFEAPASERTIPEDQLRLRKHVAAETRTTTPSGPPSALSASRSGDSGTSGPASAPKPSAAEAELISETTLRTSDHDAISTPAPAPLLSGANVKQTGAGLPSETLPQPSASSRSQRTPPHPAQQRSAPPVPLATTSEASSRLADEPPEGEPSLTAARAATSAGTNRPEISAPVTRTTGAAFRYATHSTFGLWDAEGFNAHRQDSRNRRAA